MSKDRIRIHEYLVLEKDTKGGKPQIRCIKCEAILCDASKNYKEFVPYIDRDPRELNHGLIDPNWTIYREYYCPKCATLLEVDPTPPEEPHIWDVQIKLP